MDFWKEEGYDSLISRGGKRLTINLNPKEVFIGLPTSTTINIIFCHEFFYHKLNFMKKSLLATNFLFVSKNMASIILVEYITFFHKFTHGKILSITMNLLFVVKNMARITFAKDITLCPELHFLPQNYLRQNITFNRKFTFCL